MYHYSHILKQKDDIIDSLTKNNSYLTSFICNLDKRKENISENQFDISYFNKLVKLYRNSVLENARNKKIIFELNHTKDLLQKENVEIVKKNKFLENNSEKLHNSTKCLICKDKSINTLITPCNHLHICNSCFEQIKEDRLCPVCGCPFESSIRIYNNFE